VLSASPSILDSESSHDATDHDDSLPQDRTKALKPTKHALHDSDSDDDASRAPSEDEDIDGWGTSKKDYYDADVIETEADALEEEAEARRLQQKQLQGMTEADFGFDEAEWLDAGKGGEGSEEEGDEIGEGRLTREVLPQLEITDEMPLEERSKILRTRYPEFEPLSREFLELQEVHEDLKLSVEAAMAVQKHNAHRSSPSTAEDHADKIPVAALKHTALSAYLAALCMYFTLLTSSPPSTNGKPTAMPPSELRDHPIMDSLMSTRSLWNQVKDLAIPEPPNSSISFLPLPDSKTNGLTKPINHTTKPTSTAPPKKKPRKRKTRAEKAAEAALASAAARRAERLQETEASLASLSSLTQPHPRPLKPKPKNPHPPSDNSSDLGDPATLPAHEAAHKASVKKSLKFYTSQIASKAARREHAGRDAGGDADLPYKERLRERQERLNAAAEKRGRKNPEAAELGGEEEMDEREIAAARDVRGGGDEYYDLISSRSAQKKAAKAEAAAALSLTEPSSRVGDGEGVADGKRAVSYAIEKNKGLAPKRKKEVRNPRVKKRRKYEEKKKKLGSVRQVWRGGEGRGYEGEKTGIKGGLVRSVKL